MTVLTRMREMLQPAPAIELDELCPKTLLLDVTPGDCERGVRRDDYRCVAARATARRFDGADVRVGSGWIDVTTPAASLPTWCRRAAGADPRL